MAFSSCEKLHLPPFGWKNIGRNQKEGVIGKMKKVLYWLPRVLAILFIAFISMFALDVFGEPQWFLALFMHLIPSLILIGITLVAWRHERVGGFLFLVIGLVMMSFYHSPIIASPAFVIGVLFLGRNYLLQI